MTESQTMRQLLLAYRLDELSPEERQATEERMFNEQDFSDLMQEAEYDLVDDYHSGRLTALERRRTEAAFPQEQVLHRPPLLFQEGVSGSPWAQVSRSSVAQGWFRFPVAAGALFLVTVLGGLLFYKSLHPADHPTSLSKQAAPSDSAENHGVPTPPVVADTKRFPADDTTAVLFLPSAVSRGAESLSLQVHPGLRTILVQWVPPSDIASRNFSLSVNDNGRALDAVPQDNGLTTIDGAEVVEFHLAPAALAGVENHGKLLFLLRDDGNPPTVEAEFQVSVVRRR